jgi:hypothetical protein
MLGWGGGGGCWHVSSVMNCTGNVYSSDCEACHCKAAGARNFLSPVCIVPRSLIAMSCLHLLGLVLRQRGNSVFLNSFYEILFMLSLKIPV